MSKPIDLSRMKGIFTPIITPVDSDENIDIDRLRAQVNFVIDHGVDGILAFGSNSEFYMFSDNEMLAATETIVDEAAGRVPVIFGIGHIRTKAAVNLAQRASQLDIDGIALLHPMFIQPTEEALRHHYERVAQAVPDTFLFIYHNPGRCGYALSNDLIVDLAHRVPNILGIKDSTGDITRLQELVRRCSDIDFTVFVGKDTVVFPGLCCGAQGAVCSTANIFPELVCGIYDKFVSGDFEGSRSNQFRLNPVRLSQDAASFPAATKDMANLLGMNVGASVLPTEATDGAALTGMVQSMRDAGLLPQGITN